MSHKEDKEDYDVPPMDHFSKARQDELLWINSPGQGQSFDQIDMLRSKEQSFIRKLIGTFWRKKTLLTTDPAISWKEYHELRQA